MENLFDIIIINAEDSFWYADKIDERFTVKKTADPDLYKLPGEGRWMWKKDCIKIPDEHLPNDLFDI